MFFSFFFFLRDRFDLYIRCKLIKCGNNEAPTDTDRWNGKGEGLDRNDFHRPIRGLIITTRASVVGTEVSLITVLSRINQRRRDLLCIER